MLKTSASEGGINFSKYERIPVHVEGGRTSTLVPVPPPPHLQKVATPPQLHPHAPAPANKRQQQQHQVFKIFLQLLVCFKI